MKDFAEFLGWIAVVCFGIGILSYVVKVINKRYLKYIPISWITCVDKTLV